MAGDWIPIRTDLPDHPKTLRIAQQLRKSTDEVVGLLVRFWSWVQQHTDSGRLEGMSIELCALGARVPAKFLEALVGVDWLVVADPDLLIPEFPRWFSGAAKRRLRDAARKRAVRQNPRPESEPVRKMSAKCPQNVRIDADKMRTIGEERKGKERTGKDPPSLVPSSSENHSVLGNESFCGELANRDSPPAEESPPVQGIPIAVEAHANGFARIAPIVFQCRGKERSWRVPRELYADLVAAFDGVDMASEILKAHAWLNANPDRRKTAKGMSRFLFHWMARCVDQNGPRNAGNGPSRLPGLEDRNLAVARAFLDAKRQKGGATL